MIALTIALFFAGHVVRDGWPSFHDMTNGKLGTHAARVCGALLCGLGAFVTLDPVFAAVVFAGVLAGFYFDAKHGEAAGVDTPGAVSDAFLSGITSVLPLGVALDLLVGHHSHIGSAEFAAGLDAAGVPVLVATFVAVGLVKPAIWKAAWRLLPNRPDTWFQPTRIAAGVFGALIGAVVYLVT